MVIFITIISYACITITNRRLISSSGYVTTVCFSFEKTERFVTLHFRLNDCMFSYYSFFSVIFHHPTKRPVFFGGRGGGSLIQPTAFGGPSQAAFFIVKVSFSATIALTCVTV